MAEVEGDFWLVLAGFGEIFVDFRGFFEAFPGFFTAFSMLFELLDHSLEVVMHQKMELPMLLPQVDARLLKLGTFGAKACKKRLENSPISVDL